MMFWTKKINQRKEKKENEEKLRNLHGREVRYASRRDNQTYIEMVIGKNGIIDVTNDIFSLICDNKTIFRSPLKDLLGSDLMSLDGIILTSNNGDLDNYTEDEIMVYYKYYRKVE